MELQNKCLARLTLSDLRFLVRLGVGAEERRVPQPVRFDVICRFPALPKGCYTDDIDDTLCYEKVSQVLRDLSTREFRLIENLGWQSFSALKEILPKDHKLVVRICKLNPPIAGLEGGAHFQIEEDSGELQ